MKDHLTPCMSLLLGSLALLPSSYAFDSGSHGTTALNVTSNMTIALPPDGRLEYTNVYVAANCTLSFTPNALNTPVYLLSTGDITNNGTIDVSGGDGLTNGTAAFNAGPGGFSGGSSAYTTAGIPFGHGQGPGGGYSVGQGGSFASQGKNYTTAPVINTNTYGNLLLVPLIGGSGGAGSTGLAPTPGASGGGGGGAILIASSTRVIINGTVRARGGNGVQTLNNSQNDLYNSGSGSGGAIRIVALEVKGAGTNDVSGGMTANNVGSYFGGNGRVRIDCPPQGLGLYTKDSSSLAAAAVTSIGQSLFVFPPNSPYLYFTSAAGESITPGTNGAVSVTCYSSTSTSTNVTLQASGFLHEVPVQIVVTPENGTSFATNIVMSFATTSSVVTTNVLVNLLPNCVNRINAYARYGVQP